MRASSSTHGEELFRCLLFGNGDAPRSNTPPSHRKATRLFFLRHAVFPFALSSAVLDGWFCGDAGEQNALQQLFEESRPEGWRRASKPLGLLLTRPWSAASGWPSVADERSPLSGSRRRFFSCSCVFRLRPKLLPLQRLTGPKIAQAETLLGSSRMPRGPPLRRSGSSLWLLVQMSKSSVSSLKEASWKHTAVHEEMERF